MRVWRLLWSARVAGVLIAALGGLALLSVVVPQTSTLGAAYVADWAAAEPWLARPLLALGLDDIFSSWAYWVVSGLLAVNLTACTLRRIIKRRGTPALGSPGADAIEVTCRTGVETLARTLSSEVPLARITPVEDRGVVCVWGGWGFVGSVVMHAGLVLVVCAGLVTSLTRFESELILAEGQTVVDAESAYFNNTSLPLIGEAYGGAEITLDRLEFDYVGSTVVDARAFFTVDEDGVLRAEMARVNEPLRVGKKAFLLQEAGYAVGIRIIDEAGLPSVEAFVNLGEARPEGYFDTVDTGGFRLGLLAVPDAGRAADETQEKLNPVDPGLRVFAAPLAGDMAGEFTEIGMIRPGESMPLPAGSLELVEVRRWNRFNARADSGLPVIYLALALVVAGTVVRVVDPDRVVRVLLVRDGVVAVWSRARWGRAIAERASERVVGTVTRSVETVAVQKEDHDEC